MQVNIYRSEKIDRNRVARMMAREYCRRLRTQGFTEDQIQAFADEISASLRTEQPPRLQ